jgi:hypothetical protein
MIFKYLSRVRRCARFGARDFGRFGVRSGVRGDARRQKGIIGLFLILALASSTGMAVLHVIESNTPYIYLKQYREGKDRSITSARVCRDYVIDMFRQNIEYDVTLSKYGEGELLSFDSRYVSSVAGSAPLVAGDTLVGNARFRTDFMCEFVSVDSREGQVSFVVNSKDFLSGLYTEIETVLEIHKYGSAGAESLSMASTTNTGWIDSVNSNSKYVKVLFSREI